MFYWVMYDIASPKRLGRIARLCTGTGLQRIQKSVFLGEVTQEQLVKMREAILDTINPAEDRVLILPVSRGQLNHSISLGLGSRIFEACLRKPLVFL